MRVAVAGVGLGVLLGFGVIAPETAQSRPGKIEADTRLGEISAEYEGRCPHYPSMHSITTPIRGLEGSPEAGPINDGIAELWQYEVSEEGAVVARPLATELHGSVDCRLGPPGRRPR